jgi:hypothetical protein
MSDDQENVNQAAGDMEDEPAEEPGYETDNEDDLEQRQEHGEVSFSATSNWSRWREQVRARGILLGPQGHGCLC